LNEKNNYTEPGVSGNVGKPPSPELGVRRRKTMSKIKILVILLVAGIAFVAYDVNNVREVNALPFNKNLEKIVKDKELIGKTEKEVVLALGEPSYRRVYDDEDYTLNYAPSILLPANKFQAHFRSDGILRTIELMDD